MNKYLVIYKTGENENQCAILKANDGSSSNPAFWDLQEAVEIVAVVGLDSDSFPNLDVTFLDVWINEEKVLPADDE